MHDPTRPKRHSAAASRRFFLAWGRTRYASRCARDDADRALKNNLRDHAPTHAESVGNFPQFVDASMSRTHIDQI